MEHISAKQVFIRLSKFQYTFLTGHITAHYS